MGDLVSRFGLCAGVAVLMVVGCGIFEDTGSTKSDAPEALMRVAVPGWKAEGPHSVLQIAAPAEGKGAKEREILPYALAPSAVLKLGEGVIVLITSGTPADDEGNQQIGHASSAMLGAYWFEKRDERWFKVAEQPGFALEGFSGLPGELRQLDLGGGKIALAVNNGSCWQGACGEWLALYAVDGRRMTKIFADLISSDNESESASGSCSDLLALDAGAQRRVSQDEYSSVLGCYQIDGRATIQPTGKGVGQLVIEFSGKMASEEIVPVVPKPAQSLAQDESESEELEEEFLVTMEAVQRRQVYSFRNGRYVLLRGQNPNPTL